MDDVYGSASGSAFSSLHLQDLAERLADYARRTREEQQGELQLQIESSEDTTDGSGPWMYRGVRWLARKAFKGFREHVLPGNIIMPNNRCVQLRPVGGPSRSCMRPENSCCRQAPFAHGRLFQWTLFPCLCCACASLFRCRAFKAYSLFIVILALFTCWEMPFNFAFLSGGATSLPLAIANAVVDLFFIYNILCNFRLAYKDAVTQKLITNRARIAVKYVSQFVPQCALVQAFKGLPSIGPAVAASSNASLPVCQGGIPFTMFLPSFSRFLCVGTFLDGSLSMRWPVCLGTSSGR